MNVDGTRVFASLTHGIANDCRQANAKLKETLENYNFGAFLIERSCCRCPNDDCNTSFLLILQSREFIRLKRQVDYEVRPTFLVHQSFREIMESDRRIRLNLLGENSIGIQVGPQMINKYVDASPPSSNSFCQTDYKVWKTDTAGQTDDVVKKEAEVQTIPEQPQLSVNTIQRPDSQPDAPEQTEPLVAGVRTLEIQQEEDEDVIMRLNNTGPDAHPVEVKVEEDIEEAPVIREPEVVPEKEVKEEPPEEVTVIHYQSTPPPPPPRMVSAPAAPALPEPPQNAFSSMLKRIFSSATSPISESQDSSSTNSSAFFTPTSTSKSQSTPGSSSAKRPKYTDVDQCLMCWDVSNYTEDECCRHIQETHYSIPRFKCNVCDKFLYKAKDAHDHARNHMQQGRGDDPIIDCLEITEENLKKFMRAARQCFPDKFRNSSGQEIAEIIKQLP